MHRFEVPGGFWHLTNRGVAKCDIYKDDFDRLRFLALLARAVELYGWTVVAYCLMNNHFHLFIQTLEPTLSAGAKMILEEYAKGFNRKYDRTGHLFQGRFAAQLVDNASYGLNVARYIVLNPERAGLVERACDWRWSSYRATAGLIEGPRWLDPSAVLAEFDPLDPVRASALYKDFVLEGRGRNESPWDHIRHQSILGSEDFARKTFQQLEPIKLVI
jgi:putative transposase